MYSGTGPPTSSEAGVPRCCEVSASSVLYRRQLLQPASAAVPLDACCLVQRRRQPCQVRAKAQRFQKHYSTGCCSNNQNSKYRFREAHALRTPLYSGVRNGGPSETQFLETCFLHVLCLAWMLALRQHRATATTQRCQACLGRSAQDWPARRRKTKTEKHNLYGGLAKGRPVDGDAILETSLRRYESSCHSGNV